MRAEFRQVSKSYNGHRALDFLSRHCRPPFLAMFVVLFTNLLLGHRRAWPPLDIRPLAVIRHQCAVSGCHFT